MGWLRLRGGHRPHQHLAPPQHPSPPRPGRAALPPNAAARLSAGGGGHHRSPQCPPPPAIPPDQVNMNMNMSEAIDRILDLRRAGFGFLHHHDEDSQVVAVQGPAGPRRAHRDRADPRRARRAGRPVPRRRPRSRRLAPDRHHHHRRHHRVARRCSTCPPRRPGMFRHSPGPSRPASGSRPMARPLNPPGRAARSRRAGASSSCRRHPPPRLPTSESKGGRLGMMVTRSMIERMPP